MALVGLRPDIVMEICQKAFSFWNYQVSQEQSIISSINQTLTGRIRQLEFENNQLKLRQSSKSLRYLFIEAFNNVLYKKTSVHLIKVNPVCFVAIRYHAIVLNRYAFL